MTYNLANTAGNTVQIPVVNAWAAATQVNEGDSISGGSPAGSQSDFDPTQVLLTLTKKASWSDVTEEAIEDGGIAVVQNQVITRLSRELAQATDIGGFNAFKAAFANVGKTASYANYSTNFVVSPEAFAYGVKRQPTVEVFYDNDTDTHRFRATIRNGFVGIRPAFGKAVYSNGVLGNTTANTIASLEDFAKAVAALRAVNAPTMANGMYAAFIDPVTEFHLSSQLNSVTAATIPDLSNLGNQALLNGAIGQAVGCMFFRTNNLPVSTTVTPPQGNGE